MWFQTGKIWIELQTIETRRKFRSFFNWSWDGHIFSKKKNNVIKKKELDAFDCKKKNLKMLYKFPKFASKKYLKQKS